MIVPISNSISPSPDASIQIIATFLVIYLAFHTLWVAPT